MPQVLFRLPLVMPEDAEEQVLPKGDTVIAMQVKRGVGRRAVCRILGLQRRCHSFNHFSPFPPDWSAS